MLSSLAFSLFICYSLAFEPVQVNFNELNGESERLLTGLTDLGLITITDIPGYKELRENVLLASNDCLDSSKESALLLELEDGTKRFTMASSSQIGLSKFEGMDSTKEACNQFSALHSKFTGLVDDVVSKFTSALDASLTDLESSPIMLDTETMEHSFSISDIVSKGTHLEHFHSYEKATTLDDLYSPNFARKLHKDHGLFIVMTPALTFNEAESNDHGFFVELSNGEIVQPDFGKDGNQLVIMIGDGFVQWLNPKIKENLVATSHAVVMPFSSAEKSKRAWYGRMILPKGSMFLEPQQKTFKELEESMLSSEKINTEHSACSQGMVLNPRTLQTCSNDQLACWRDCVDISCGNNEDALCGSYDGEDFIECGDDEHGVQCQAECVLKATDIRPIVGNDFCNGIIVSMYMDGFTGVKDPNQGCLVFLFPKFVLDSEAKYFAASVFTVLIGMITEGIANLRRRISTKVKDSSKKSIQRIILYALQIIFGYIAMLIAMTYSLLLFFMIVFGLTLGHRIFNFNVKPGEFKDPCCAEATPVEDPEHYHK